ncbi:hypothetical protein CKO12_13635 [Chromatium okenii]|uniref:hypothetical protein n=1 Tax=Chromatium okenii TaxID=61644 RepID=UPI001904CE3A|nr:hypothetical protein [Chromatium okenii]MBK1642890.1 hypothetical protein [Chromatium okenii]
MTKNTNLLASWLVLFNFLLLILVGFGVYEFVPDSMRDERFSLTLALICFAIFLSLAIAILMMIIKSKAPFPAYFALDTGIFIYTVGIGLVAFLFWLVGDLSYAKYALLQFGWFVAGFFMIGGISILSFFSGNLENQDIASKEALIRLEVALNEIANISSSCPDASKEALRLAEAVHFSDPVLPESSLSIHSRLEEIATSLIKASSEGQGSKEVIIGELAKIQTLLKQREEAVRLFKL